VTIASWYVAALLRAAVHVNTLLAMFFTALDIVMRVVYIGLMSLLLGTGASRFLLAS
jgi:hypothetical protein